METKMITEILLPGQHFLSSFQKMDDLGERIEEHRLYYLFSEKLDSAKWKVNFSFERIGRQYRLASESSFGLGYSSSDMISFIVEPGSEIKLTNDFKCSISETTQGVTLFGNIKEKQQDMIYDFNFLVFKEICQDSVVVETHWKRGI